MGKGVFTGTAETNGANRVRWEAELAAGFEGLAGVIFEGAIGVGRAGGVEAEAHSTGSIGGEAGGICILGAFTGFIWGAFDVAVRHFALIIESNACKSCDR